MYRFEEVPTENTTFPDSWEYTEEFLVRISFLEPCYYSYVETPREQVPKH